MVKIVACRNAQYLLQQSNKKNIRKEKMIFIQNEDMMNTVSHFRVLDKIFRIRVNAGKVNIFERNFSGKDIEYTSE